MASKNGYIISAYFLAVALAGLLFFVFGYESTVRILESLRSLGGTGIIIFTIFFIIGTLIFFPLTLLAFSGGVLYGFTNGFLISLLSAVAGACLGFLLSRYICRDWIHKKLIKHGKFETFRESVSKHDWKIAILSRISLILPYTLLNYAFGLTQLSFWRYTYITFFAMIPSTLLYVYLGTVSGTIAAYFQGHKTLSPFEIGWGIVALLASVALVIYLGNFAKKLKTT